MLNLSYAIMINLPQNIPYDKSAGQMTCIEDFFYTQMSNLLFNISIITLY